MKRTIRLTESEFRRTLEEAVKKTLNEMEGITYRQMRNVLGIEDDDELNAAVDAEDTEELEGEIARAICDANGVKSSLYSHNVFSFDKVADVLKNQFGMKYVGGNDEEECHYFRNNDYEVMICPQVYYPRQGNFYFRNFLVSRV